MSFSLLFMFVRTHIHIYILKSWTWKGTKRVNAHIPLITENAPFVDKCSLQIIQNNKLTGLHPIEPGVPEIYLNSLRVFLVVMPVRNMANSKEQSHKNAKEGHWQLSNQKHWTSLKFEDKVAEATIPGRDTTRKLPATWLLRRKVEQNPQVT